MVPFWPIKINNEIGHWVSKPEMLLEIPCCLEKGLHLIDALRKTCDAVKRLFLTIDEVDDVEDRLNHVFEVHLSLRNG